MNQYTGYCPCEYCPFQKVILKKYECSYSGITAIIESMSHSDVISIYNDCCFREKTYSQIIATYHGENYES